MRDRVTQFALGISAGIFTYCLIVLRTVAAASGADSFRAWRCHLASFSRSLGSASSFSSFVTSPLRSGLERHCLGRPGNRRGRRPTSRRSSARGRLMTPRIARRSRCRDAPGRQSRPGGMVSSRRRQRRAPGLVRITRPSCGSNAASAFYRSRHRDCLIALAAPPPEEIIAGLQAAYGVDRRRTVEQDAAFGIRQSWTWRCEHSPPASTAPRRP